jgi:hypothetical protein
MGAASPMGSMDARDGIPTQACPECGANPNPRRGNIQVYTPSSEAYSPRAFDSLHQRLEEYKLLLDEYENMKEMNQ